MIVLMMAFDPSASNILHIDELRNMAAAILWYTQYSGQIEHLLKSV